MAGVCVRTGIDLVPLARFEQAWRDGNGAFERRLFHPSELVDRRAEHLAGIFAAKEAAAKALDLPPGAWLEIEVRPAASGKPVLHLSAAAGSEVISSDISISHAGEYVMAVCMLLCREDAGDDAQPR